MGETLVWTGIEELRRKVEHVATLDCPVLLVGESGTGKTQIAKYIHGASKRGAEAQGSPHIL
jgi:DNA-binding NtrC family response regulator